MDVTLLVIGWRDSLYMAALRLRRMTPSLGRFGVGDSGVGACGGGGTGSVDADIVWYWNNTNNKCNDDNEEENKEIPVPQSFVGEDV